MTRWLLKTVAADGAAHGGFVWPLEVGAEVTAPDWSDAIECGGGLHGLLDGRGNGTLLSWSPGAVWLVAEVPADARLVDLVGKKMFFGVHRIRENKNFENPKGSGNWVPGPEERITNKIDKVFNEDKKTVNEVMGGEPASFYQKWEAEFGTDTVDKYKAVKADAKSGAPTANRTGGTNDDAIFG